MNSVKFLLPILLLVFLSRAALSESTISIENLWINEAPPNMTVLAAYGVINNESDSDLVLEKITSPHFEAIEIHTIIVKNDVNKMIKQDTLNIAAHAQSEFSPGGMHMMLYTPSKALKKGDKVDFTFHFSDGIQIETCAVVKKLSDTTEHHHHHHHD